MWGGELDLKECSNPEALAAVQMGHASKTEDLRWSPSRVQRADTELDPSRITKLIDKEFVWFDPQRGFCTDADNLKQSGIDKAFPYIFAAAMTAMSFGAGRENWGQIIISLPGLGGRAVLTVQQAQAQTVWAQQVLAQALGRLAAGQMGAGAAALALAQGQLALREGRRCCHRLWLRGHGAAGCVGRFAI